MKALSIILTLSAFVLSLFVFLREDSNASTLSYIGEANRTWFFFFSLILVLAFCLNIILFTKTNGIKNRKLRFTIYTLLCIAFILSFLQSIIIDFTFHEMHLLFASTYTAFASFAIIAAIIAKLKYSGNKHGFYYLAMLLLTGGINFYAIRVYGWLIASYQWLFISAMLISSFAMAFTDRRQ
jgi:hypothetical protein